MHGFQKVIKNQLKFALIQMENKKSGIRLRHLDLQSDEANKRDLSPNNPNRKKIFDKNQRMKLAERLTADDRQKRKTKQEEQNFNEYEELIQNLKKKTMEIELRDDAIKYLNKQIEDLKNQLRLKDKQIARLNQEVATLQKDQLAAKNTHPDNVFQSFKHPSQMNSYSYHEVNRPNNSILETANPKIRPPFQQNRINEQISLSNMNNFKHNIEQRNEEADIVSPFMALNKTHSFSNHRQTKKQIKTSRISNQSDFHPSSTEFSGFNKRKNNNQFDFSKEQYVPKRTMLDSVNKQLQKFNIFGQGPPEAKKQVFSKSKLEIEDSREFKFEEFDEKAMFLDRM